MKKILFIVGSLRKESFNREFAKLAESFLSGKAEVSYLDYSDVPFMNQDLEFPVPAAVSELRKTVAAADGVWVFSPEYNYSFPGHVKNVIDWLSRPATPEDRMNPTLLVGKKFTLAGAGGTGMTARCRENLTVLLKNLKAEVMTEHQTGVALNVEAWTEGRMILTDEQKKQLQEQAEAFLAYI